ncbi:uncharacterized protein [Rutidosis leptorrhynchoides]|uniref:uncharacterized protein n=1 Tax=Rutidosis leptorrhynchoides TaxID=125765 RepID=UPI003A998594
MLFCVIGVLLPLNSGHNDFQKVIVAALHPFRSYKMVADVGDHPIAINVCRNFVTVSKYKTLLDDYLAHYEGHCDHTQKRLYTKRYGMEAQKTCFILENDKFFEVILGANKSLYIGQGQFAMFRTKTKFTP